MNILEIKNLQKRYKKTVAVDGVSLSIPSGASYGLLGPNGAGKSTTMGCLLGLLPYEGGQVRFEGKFTAKQWTKNIGFVPQELAIYPELTAAENVSFFCSLYKISGAQLKRRVDETLDFVGLSDVRNRKSGEFSGGMKRRLNIACAVAHEPKLIIMDEPTVGIDPQSRNRILENVRELNSRGTTIIYTTHYMPEVEEICNRVAVIDHGKVIAEGTKQEILALMGKDETVALTLSGGDITAFVMAAEELPGVHEAVNENGIVRVRYDKDVPAIEGLVRLAGTLGLIVARVVSEEPKLEEIFLTLTGKTLRDRA
jgi:ABC-2 type transport system ATP-binding protein